MIVLGAFIWGLWPSLTEAKEEEKTYLPLVASQVPLEFTASSADSVPAVQDKVIDDGAAPAAAGPATTSGVPNWVTP